MKDAPAKLIGDALRIAEELSAKLSEAKASGWEKKSVVRAGALFAKALVISQD